ncbi:histidine phosphatase family protein [Bacillus sp. FJAT-49736]|uniref:histidine phosphatase family protein n=1 Tax=Bacillus sp. FJAT-49736 TaxID=2833582 RepID=UPI001BCA4DA3|nr:histidine phosphatase family protein [Bacillus sp. FJAT-49736]MBS4175089.1 histidine phosphatase family protein [Bacillus sp. FJAT-49736]
METNLYFVRHAHSTFTPEELKRPLSEKGLKDATRVTELLKDKKIHHVVSSPYLRAVQTVQGIASVAGKEIHILDGLKERKLAAGVVEDFETAIRKVWGNPDFAWEGGESNNTAQQRGVQATKKILKNFAGTNIAIGTHGNIMVLIMNYFDRQYGFEFWEQLAMPDIYKLSFENDEFLGCSRIWE